MRRSDGLDANAVPFPLGHEGGRVERGKIGFIDGVREHRWPEWRGLAACGFFAATFQPGKQIDVGRLQPGPQHFDVLGIGAIERRERGFR